MTGAASLEPLPIERTIGPFTATFAVVANMVGAGIFTTTGFLVRDIGSSTAVLIAWALGGTIALCGALSYGEIASTVAENGGEYRLLARIYHPAAGVVAGLVSLLAGFCAPIAAASLAFGSYLHAILPQVSPVQAAAVLIVVVGAIHAIRVETGGQFQNVFTVAKILLILALIVGGLIAGDLGGLVAPDPTPLAGALISPAFAVGLIFISYSYSGWNAAAYLAGEVRNPGRYLPMALLGGTLIVTLLYLGLNLVFLCSASTSELAGKVEVGHVAAVRLFGERAGALLSGLIALALVSSVSAMTMVGGRVYEEMGRDFIAIAHLRRKRKRGGPTAAITLQAGIALLMVATAIFESLLTYIGFTLSLSAALTVAGVFVLRIRQSHRERPFSTWGYPVTPLAFILFSGWMVTHGLIERPSQALAGLFTIAAGLLLYVVLRELGTADPEALTQKGDLE